MGRSRVYREQHYDFGRQILALRTRAALTQAELASKIGVHRRSLQNWETGESYPKAETLQRLIELFLAYHVLTPDHEEADARALWQLAATDSTQALSPFDPQWFARVLAASGGGPRHLPPSTPISNPTPRIIIDWGEAITTPHLAGRTGELETLHQWIGHESCRVVAILGLGGMGKSSLAVTFAHRALEEFEFVFFHSLQNGPSLAHLLDQTIRTITHQQAYLPEILPETLPETLADKIARLVQLFRQHRCLLILDNFETLLQPGALTGTYRPGYAEYGTLLQWLGERDHQSCLLLTSREKPVEIGPLEGRSAPVRTLHLEGLEPQACRMILDTKDIVASADEISRLARLFAGNPLALNLVSEPIRELFGGDVAAFLATGEAYFNGVGDLLEEQFVRSTPLEQSMMRWLAIVREPVAVNVLLATLGESATKSEILRALESLQRRMQIARAADRPAFTLQPVILEWVADHLAEGLYAEIMAGAPALLQRHMLVQATAKEYVRHSQERLIALPLLERLTLADGGGEIGKRALTRRLTALLDRWRGQPAAHQQFGPGNVVNLLRLLRGDLRGLNLAGLIIQQGYFRGVEAQEADLTAVTLHDSVFTEIFGSLTALASDRRGEQWATSSRRGEVLIWQSTGTPAHQTLQRLWQAHPDMIVSLAFSPNGRTLATSGGWDGSVKVWDVAYGALLWVGHHTSHVNTVAFAPNGAVLASSGDDAAVCLWDATSGALLARLVHPTAVAGLAWRADGTALAVGDADGTIHLWALDAQWQVVTRQSFAAHRARVDGLAFAPHALLQAAPDVAPHESRLASASWDGSVKVWALPALWASLDGLSLHDLAPRYTFNDHPDRAVRLAWNATGDLLASSSRDPTIWLWDTRTGLPRQRFDDHRDGVYGLAFTPDDRTLLSSSDDGTLRAWEVATGQCVLVMQGYANSLYAVDWHPDGTQLVSGGTDRAVTIHTRTPTQPPRTLQPPPGSVPGIVLGVGWSADGRWIASSEWDNLIRLWDVHAGTLGGVIRDEREQKEGNTYFSALAWSPDGRLACGSYRHGLFIWEPATRRPHWLHRQQPTWIRAVAWHAQSRFVAGGDEQGTIYLWHTARDIVRDAAHVTGHDQGKYALLHALNGHYREVLSLAWSPPQFAGDTRLLSGGLGQAGGELFVWDGVRGTLLHQLVGHPTTVCAVAWGATPNEVISGDSEGMVRWWNLARGEIVRVQKAHQGVVQSLARSPDGTQVASCGDDGAIQLWDLARGDHLQTLRRDRPYERMRIAGVGGITPAQRISLLALGAVEG